MEIYTFILHCIYYKPISAYQPYYTPQDWLKNKSSTYKNLKHAFDTCLCLFYFCVFPINKNKNLNCLEYHPMNHS